MNKAQLKQLKSNVAGKPKTSLQPHSDPVDEPSLGSSADPYYEPEDERILSSVLIMEPGCHVQYNRDCIEVTKGKSKYQITIKQLG